MHPTRPPATFARVPGPLPLEPPGEHVHEDRVLARAELLAPRLEETHEGELGGLQVGHMQHCTCKLWLLLGTSGPSGMIERVLYETRIRLGLSQVELAEQAGLSPAAISLIERGHRNPSPSAREALATVLDQVAAAVRQS